jgi:hypothetical protein
LEGAEEEEEEEEVAVVVEGAVVEAQAVAVRLVGGQVAAMPLR